jgi:hypothetical protein
MKLLLCGALAAGALSPDFNCGDCLPDRDPPPRGRPETAAKRDGSPVWPLRALCARARQVEPVTARRLVRVASGFGASAIMRSVCAEDYGEAVDGLASKIADALGSCE